MAAKQKAFDITDDTIENIIEKPIEKILPDSMMPYSEYVIMDRALPRVEDGLKPVQRRILYAMYDLGMKPEGAYKKSARVVGECLGKYHPHGDRSVYDAMVRMAQDFNMRMTLVDGHGNFGSIDGDSAAAMRYTEVKMAPLATELLRDIEKNTVKWNKNFDDTLEEPDVLPGRFPNLLVNGATGIAIGLATNIPPHNLTEVIDGCITMIDEPRTKLTDLVKIIKGPDFPTGGFIVGGDAITEMYETGHGKVLMRAKADIENTDGNRQNIVITEIPFNVNKENLQKKIFDLKETKKDILGGIADIADESDRNGMRIVVKLKKGEDPAKILTYLFKHTDLECNFNVNIVAIANGRPKQMGLIPILKYYLDFQRSIIYKRSLNEIGIAKKRAHILDGFSLIMPAIDEVIAIIRASSARSDAKAKLRERFSLTEAQAEAILSLQLGNINKLDVTKFEKELKELNQKIASLDKILSSVREQDRVIREELIEIRDKYKSKRLTTIVDSLECLDIKPFDPTKRTTRRAMIAADSFGGIKVMSCRNYVSAVRDAVTSGIDGLTSSLVQAEPENTNIIFGSLGNAYRADIDTIKEKRWEERGEPLSNIYPEAPEGEKAVCVITASQEDLEKDFYIYTKNGMVKKTVFKNYIVNKDTYQAVVLKDGDEVIGGEFAVSEATILFVTSDGLCINTFAGDYPVQGRIAGGVIGASLNDGESVVYAGQTTVEAEAEPGGAVCWSPVGEIAVITSKGFAKKVLVTEFEPMKRNRKGVKIIDMDNNTRVVFASKVLDPFEIAIIDENNEVTVTDTESIRLDNRIGKGRSAIRGLKISKIVKHMEEF